MNLISSLGISMVESYGMIFTQKNFEALQALEKKYNLIPRLHLYMVIKTPNFKFQKKEIEFNNNKVIGKIYSVDNLVTTEFELEFKMKIGSVNLSKNNDEIEVLDVNNKIILNLNIINLLLYYGMKIDCEVVYIGKSFGNNGSRNVYDRLESHKTLQKIYFEKEDDRSIYLTAWNFDRNTMTIVGPDSKSEENLDKLTTQLELECNPYDSISKEQEISFTEAALIRYFQPKYNTEYKYTFPSNKHADYTDCYKMKLDYIAVEMNTTRLNFKLYSDEVLAEYSHDIFFDLKGKKNLYDFFGII